MSFYETQEPPSKRSRLSDELEEHESPSESPGIAQIEQRFLSTAPPHPHDSIPSDPSNQVDYRFSHIPSLSPADPPGMPDPHTDHPLPPTPCFTQAVEHTPAPSQVRRTKSARNSAPSLDLSDVPTDLKPMPSQRPGTGTSQYRGVTRPKRSGSDKWQAQISSGGVNYYLGLFDTEEAAAVAYARAYYKLMGPGALSRQSHQPPGSPLTANGMLPITDPASPGFQIVAAMLSNPSALGLTTPLEVLQLLSSLTAANPGNPAVFSPPVINESPTTSTLLPVTSNPPYDSNTSYFPPDYPHSS